MKDDQFTITANYAVPPALVFDAWINEQLIHKWLFVGPTSEIVKVEIDLAVGEKFSIQEHERTNNEYIDHYGKYTAINKPARLAFTLSVPTHFDGETKVDITITAKEEGCELVFIQTGVPKNVTEESWKMMLQQLKLTLENQ